MSTPTKLTGSEFERLVQEQCVLYERSRLACIGRYGVQAVRNMEEWVIMPSLPDFEGVLHTGNQIIFDCKVCSQASFPFDKYRSETRGARSRQLRHMLKRSRFGAKCYFLMHWNERNLVKKTIPATTVMVPVMHDFDFWHHVESGEIKSMNRDDSLTIGVEVHWIADDGRRKLRPDFLGVVA